MTADTHSLAGSMSDAAERRLRSAECRYTPVWSDETGLPTEDAVITFVLTSTILVNTLVITYG
jgi:hypothetical protein